MAKLKKVPVPKAKTEYKKKQRWAKAQASGSLRMVKDKGLSVTGSKGRTRSLKKDFPNRGTDPLSAATKIDRPVGHRAPIRNKPPWARGSTIAKKTLKKLGKAGTAVFGYGLKTKGSRK